MDAPRTRLLVGGTLVAGLLLCPLLSAGILTPCHGEDELPMSCCPDREGASSPAKPSPPALAVGAPLADAVLMAVLEPRRPAADPGPEGRASAAELHLLHSVFLI
jgi:hypothetical protein